MSERPYMQLWVADYLGDTQHLTTEQHGAYMLLLMAMWRAGGYLPNDHKKLSRIVRLPVAKWQRLADDVLALCIVEGDQITQKRIKIEIEKARKFSEKQSANAKAKYLKNNDAHAATAEPTQSQNDARARVPLPLPIKASPNGEAPKTAQETITNALWANAPPILVKLGVTNQQARKMIGKWLGDKHAPEAIMRAVEQAERNGTHEPFAFVTAILKPKDKPWRKNANGWYLKPGSEPFEAWKAHYARENSPRQWDLVAAEKADEEVKVPSLWPGRGG